tara:strand:- start:1434 stop:2039 length:606 start_codon:yes stop_codon:yes gene_type:complete
MQGTDGRLDLNKYIGAAKDLANKTKTTFGDQFRVSAQDGIGGQYPWNPGRFDSSDILNYAQSRKRSLNVQLGTVDPDEPLQTQLFAGTTPFIRHDHYDFQKGTPITEHKPQSNPDFNPVWVEAYKISPTIPPDKRAKSPMPSASNPDPHGYIMQMAQSQADNTVDPKPSVANLLKPSKKPILDKELEIETEVPKEPEVETT